MTIAGMRYLRLHCSSIPAPSSSTQLCSLARRQSLPSLMHISPISPDFREQVETVDKQHVLLSIYHGQVTPCCWQGHAVHMAVSHLSPKREFSRVGTLIKSAVSSNLLVHTNLMRVPNWATHQMRKCQY